MTKSENVVDLTKAQQGKKFKGLAADNNGKVKGTIKNFLKILEFDPKFKNIRYNVLAQKLGVIDDNNNFRTWVDTDEASARLYIESQYGIRNRECLSDALLILSKKRQYHPVKDIIENIEWDGKERCENFLCKWTLCNDDEYHREVSRLIFAGGINRLYDPGCKYDTTTVFIGEQGCGKSTLCRWLAIKDEFFGEINSFDGKNSIEAIQGIFIGEVVELLALTRIREQEAVKAYLTRQVDKYRAPYEKYPVELPRQCIFIATTNKDQFIADKTGGRRWLPVKVGCDSQYIYNNKAEIKEYILQCWAEALHKYKEGEMPCNEDYRLESIIREHQADVAEEDYRLGLIEKYVENRDEVCVIEIWHKALDNLYEKPQRKDSSEIAIMLRNLGWETTCQKRFKEYGKQRVWTRKENKYGSLPWTE